VARIASVVSNGCNPDPRVVREARWLVGAGHEVTIHAFDRLENLEPESEIDGVRIIRHRVGMTRYGGTFSTMRGIQKFRKSVANSLENIDILHCHDADMLPLATKTNAKATLFDMHDLHHTWVRMANPKSILRKIVSIRMKNTMLSRAKSVDAVITSSRYFSDWLSEHEIPSIPIENRIENQEPLAIPKSPAIGYFGKIREPSSFQLLFDSLMIIEQKSRPKVIISGDGVATEKVNQLAKKYTELDIEIRSNFTHSQLSSMMGDISIMFAMYPPDRGNISEGAIPSKMFEAAAYGRPSIVNRDAPMGDICESESLGIGVDWGDTEGLAAAIIRLHGRSADLVHDELVEKEKFLEIVNALKI
jgi:glycosyltransferase involved in cell wall biosynthesis